MFKRLLIAGITFLALVLVASAADAITGKWVMEQAGMGGGPAMKTTFDMKAEGAKLTGTVQFPAFGDGPAMPPAQIANGKIDGNKVSFEVTMDAMGNSMTFKYEGAVTGNDMAMKMTFPGFDGGEPRVIDGTAKKQ